MNPVKVASLDCWHANEIIYQADGRLDDGRFCFVHYRGGRFSVWVGPRPFSDSLTREGSWVFEGEPRGPVSPSKVTRGLLDSWSEGRIEWPTRIDGYHNEPEGPAGEGPVHLGEGGV